MSKKIVIKQGPQRQRQNDIGVQTFVYDRSFRKKLDLNYTDTQLPNGEPGEVAQVGYCHAVICGDRYSDDILVVLVDGPVSWIADYSKRQYSMAYKFYLKVTKALQKHQQSSRIADYYLMYDYDDKL